MKVQLSMTLGLIALAASAVPAALGQCGMPTKAVKPAAWHPQESAAGLVRAANDESFAREDGKSIVGMWHVLFTAKTAMGEPIPATVIDDALVVWHSDHTEIMNSARPPQDGNFCLGVWEQKSKSVYYVNHFPWHSNEFPNSSPSGIGDPEGPARITELVTLGPDGDRFTGTFSLVAYDLTNKAIASFTGTLEGARITVNTTEKDLVE